MTTAPAGPSSVYFRDAKKPSCPSGTDDFQNPGQPVTIEWLGDVASIARTTAAATETRGNERVGPQHSITNLGMPRLHLVAGA